MMKSKHVKMTILQEEGGLMRKYLNDCYIAVYTVLVGLIAINVGMSGFLKAIILILFINVIINELLKVRRNKKR